MPYKKIGLTTTSVEQRETEINRFPVRMPLKYRMVAAWEVEDCKKTERILHNAFRARKVQGEFFEDGDNSLITAVSSIMTGFNVGIRVELESTDLNNDDDNDVPPPGEIPTLEDALNKFKNKPYTEFFNKFISIAKEKGFDINCPPKADRIRLNIDGSNAVMYMYPQAKRIYTDSGEIKMTHQEAAQNIFINWEEKVLVHKNNTDRGLVYSIHTDNSNINDIDTILDMAKNNPRR